MTPRQTPLVLDFLADADEATKPRYPARQMRNSTHSFLSECVGRPLKGNDGIDLRQTERVRVGVAVLDHLDPPIAREA